MNKNKILTLLLFCTALCGELKAQYSNLYYHRTGDTIEWRAPNGYYAWWEFETFYNNNMECHFVQQSPWFVQTFYDSIIVLHKLYTPTPLKIIGIAGVHFKSNDIVHFTPDSTNPVQDYYYVYEASPTDFTRVAEVPWSPFDPYRTVHVKMHSAYHGPYDTTCCGLGDADHYLKVYEYYLDSAVYVTDSFYVGGTMYGNGWLNNVGGVFAGYFSIITTNGTNPPCNPNHENQFCYVNDYQVKWRIRQGDYCNWWDWEWLNTDNSTVMGPGLVYPIIEVDTTVPPDDYCHPVSNIDILVVDSGCATITWDNFANYSQVLLQYGPLHSATDNWTTVEVTNTNPYRLCGLNPATSYGVRLKALCDKNVTPWSDVTGFFNPPSSSTPVPTVLSEQTFLSPNPAKDELCVSSSFGLSGIDIHNANGLLVYSDMVSGHLVHIPLSGFASGTYLVTIHTHLGTTTKKLIIQ